MGTYLALRVASMPVLLSAPYVSVTAMGARATTGLYFFPYWAVYIASAVLLCSFALRSSAPLFRHCPG